MLYLRNKKEKKPEAKMGIFQGLILENSEGMHSKYKIQFDYVLC